jgi:hypothetical protein
MNLSKSVSQRFEKYCPNGIPHDVCWIWQSSLDGHGYGQLSDKPNKTVLKAHRISYFKHYGRLSPDKSVCHRCDNPACVNPRHLFEGTHKDNTADMISKGRGSNPPLVRGELSGQAILTEKDVLAIRSANASGVHLSKQYGVAQSTISAIRHRKIWAHLP